MYSLEKLLKAKHIIGTFQLFLYNFFFYIWEISILINLLLKKLISYALNYIKKFLISFMKLLILK